MSVRIRSYRGPSSYSTGGYPVTLGDVGAISASSGRMVLASVVSSSPLFAEPVSSTGNQVTIMFRDSRSGGIELASATDISGIHVAIIYEGV